MNLKKILQNSELTLEQQFTLKSLEIMNLDNVTKQDVLDTLIDTVQSLMIKENIIRQIMKEEINF